MKFIKDKYGQYNHPGKPTMIPNADGRITMKGVNYPVLGIDDLGNKQMMMPGKEYQFPGNDIYEIPVRQGVKINPDGSESTHLMRAETLDGINWFTFPTLFQNPDGEWIDMSEEENWKIPMMEADRRGELKHFGADKKTALDYAKGSWKKDFLNKPKQIPEVKDGDETTEQPGLANVIKKLITNPAVLFKNPIGLIAAGVFSPHDLGKGSTLDDEHFNSLLEQIEDSERFNKLYNIYLNSINPEDRVKSELEYEVMTGKPFVFNPDEYENTIANESLENFKDGGKIYRGYNWFKNLFSRSRDIGRVRGINYNNYNTRLRDRLGYNMNFERSQ